MPIQSSLTQFLFNNRDAYPNVAMERLLVQPFYSRATQIIRGCFAERIVVSYYVWLKSSQKLNTHNRKQRIMETRPTIQVSERRTQPKTPLITITRLWSFAPTTNNITFYKKKKKNEKPAWSNKVFCFLYFLSDWQLDCYTNHLKQIYTQLGI